ncbi:hypothetical protein EMPS_10467 [Entomortierella parvispora]|uniref:AIG1-type G domain-containing protein n=1 Tax=Entomortierella parvispora TaxID=205924 RepID=A0A9P3HKK8_9FUNG|nr:hypothetical protein EMPS_10467 [Entomortierella parvispora]
MAPLQKIIFVGKTGSGKSTLCNMLVQGDLQKKNAREVSDNAAGVSCDIQLVQGRQWSACDTVGLGELQAKGAGVVDPALELLASALKAGQHGFHYIAFVVQKGRIAQENAELFDLFKATFVGAESNFVLIFTHCHSAKWIIDNQLTIKSVYGDLPIVHCDFPFNQENIDEGREKRVNSLSELERQLSVIQRSPVVPTLSRVLPPNPTPEQARVREEATRKFAISLGAFLEVGWCIFKTVMFFIQNF